MKKNGFFLFCAFALMALLPGEAIADSARMQHRFGVFAGLDDPSPSGYGANMAYHLSDNFRFQAGFGTGYDKGVNINTFGAGLKVYVSNWNFSPTLGLGVTNYTITGGSIRGISGKNTSLWLQAGFDYHAPSGFYMGLGWLYLDLGWFF
jgi:hypothetical protein